MFVVAKFHCVNRHNGFNEVPASPATRQFAPSCRTVYIVAPRLRFILVTGTLQGVWPGKPSPHLFYLVLHLSTVRRDAKAFLLFLLLVLGQEKA
ncbi:hypothetical protein E2C01_059502 [Portunus trituberculatus]|uniref:Uncharacterized protein n=1 Tax=Portunus trituberculatus TaxID=210409 RepID=A0A5B7H8J9_PORTR|nr:hypothetical protein [Portunus trituberculatus]